MDHVQVRPLCPGIVENGKNKNHTCSVYAGRGPYSTACFYHLGPNCKETPVASYEETQNITESCAICIRDHTDNNPADYQLSCCMTWFHKKCLASHQGSGPNGCICPGCRQYMNIRRESSEYKIHDLTIKLKQFEPLFTQSISQELVDNEILKEQAVLENQRDVSRQQAKDEYENKLKMIDHVYISNMNKINAETMTTRITKLQNDHRYNFEQVKTIANMNKPHDAFVNISSSLLDAISHAFSTSNNVHILISDIPPRMINPSNIPFGPPGHQYHGPPPILDGNISVDVHHIHHFDDQDFDEDDDDIY
jgi:hypothetical protein